MAGDSTCSPRSMFFLKKFLQDFFGPPSFCFTPPLLLVRVGARTIVVAP